jgi:hypothetical protein
MTDVRLKDRMLVIRWFAAEAAMAARELRDDAQAVRAEAQQVRRRSRQMLARTADERPAGARHGA